MAKTTITVNTDESEKDAIAAAADAAGMSLSAYVLSAARDRMTRDAATRYRAFLTSNPGYTALANQARQFALANAQAARARLTASHEGTAA
jgi:uncharacterized protein (DUF1778 family)